MKQYGSKKAKRRAEWFERQLQRERDQREAERRNKIMRTGRIDLIAELFGIKLK